MKRSSSSMSTKQSRREFLARSGAATGGAWMLRVAPFLAATQACATDAADNGLAFTTFSPREGADFEAFSSRIVPSDDTPGAREAGVVHFADQALGTFFDEVAPLIRGGLADLSDWVAENRPEAGHFSEMSDAEQDEVMAVLEQEDPGFFGFARMLVLMGLLADAQHGGNKDDVGWDLIGFEKSFAYLPPFGYYDRDEHGGVTEGGAQ